MIHAAKFKTSRRLRRVHTMLADGGWHSTWDIMISCRVVAVGTVMSELVPTARLSSAGGSRRGNDRGADFQIPDDAAGAGE